MTPTFRHALAGLMTLLPALASAQTLPALPATPALPPVSLPSAPVVSVPSTPVVSLPVSPPALPSTPALPLPNLPDLPVSTPAVPPVASLPLPPGTEPLLQSVLGLLPAPLPDAVNGLTSQLAGQLGSLPLAGSAVGSVSPLLPYLPAALAELVQGGVGPSLGCEASPECWLSAVTTPQRDEPSPLTCELLGAPSLRLAFGSLPASQPAREHRIHSSVAVRCPAGLRFQLSLSGLAGRSSGDASRIPATVGSAPVWIDLRSSDLPLHEAVFDATGEVQMIPLEAWVSDLEQLGRTPNTSGELRLAQPVTLAVLPGL